MYVGVSSLREALEEILDKFSLEVSDFANTESEIYDSVHAAAQINSSNPERFIHWHDIVSSPVDATLRPEGFAHGFT